MKKFLVVGLVLFSLPTSSQSQYLDCPFLGSEGWGSREIVIALQDTAQSTTFEVENLYDPGVPVITGTVDGGYSSQEDWPDWWFENEVPDCDSFPNCTYFPDNVPHRLSIGALDLLVVACDWNNPLPELGFYCFSPSNQKFADFRVTNCAGDSYMRVEPYYIESPDLEETGLYLSSSWVAPYDIRTHYCGLLEGKPYTDCIESASGPAIFISTQLPSDINHPTFSMQWGLEVVPEWNIDAFTNLTLNFPTQNKGLRVDGTLYVDNLDITGQGADVDVNQGGHFLVKPSSSGFSVPSSRTMHVEAGASLTFLEGVQSDRAAIDVYGTLNLDAVSTVELEDWGIIRAKSGGTVNLLTQPTFGVNAEIGCDGGTVDTHNNMILDANQSCIACKSGGTLNLAAGKTITLQNGAFVMASDGGELKLENGSKIVVKSGSKIRFDTGGGVNVPSGAVVEVEVQSGGEFLVESQMILDGSGTLKLTGSGDFTVDGQIWIKSGATLDIAPGITFDMGLDGYIQADGTLDAQGTSSNKITFDWPATYTSVSKVLLNGPGANSSVLKHVDITDAKYGLYLIGVSSATIEDVDISSTQNNSVGIYADDSSVDIDDVYITGVKRAGIEVRDGGPSLFNSEISSPSTYGIYVYDGTFDTGGDDVVGANVITGATYGVYADASTVTLGEDLGGVEYGGYNEVRNHSSKLLYAKSSSDITAQMTWWGSSSPSSSSFYADGTSTVDYSNYLLNPPGAKTALIPKDAGEAGGGVPIPEFNRYDFNSGQLVAYLQALRRGEGRRSSKAEAFSILNSSSRALTDKTVTVLTKYIMGDWMAEGDYESAISVGEAFLANRTAFDLDLQADVAETLFRAYVNVDGNVAKAREMLELISPSTRGDQLERLESFLPSETSVIRSNYKLEDRKEVEEDGSTVSIQAYPNPFNPQVTLRIEMPEAGNLRVAIYDALGRELKVLADGYEPAGVFSVQFDGSPFPTGTYFYRATTEDTVFSGELILIK